MNLNDALIDMQTILRAEAQRRRVALEVRQQSPDVDIVGDRIQIQQMLINLVLNAMDAVADEPEGGRMVSVSVTKTADTAFLNVNDTGHGIRVIISTSCSTPFSAPSRGASALVFRSFEHSSDPWRQGAGGEQAVRRSNFPSRVPAGSDEVNGGGSMTSKATIHVVDDDEPTRTALIRLLRASGFEAVGYSSAGEFLINRPGDGLGCLLLDIHMPSPSGLDLQAALREQKIPLPVVFMTGHANIASCLAAMKGGALDYLEKPVDPNVLLDSIKRALQRDQEARAARQERNELWSSFKSLTPRERQVFDLVVSGKLNKQIADALDIAERTVKAQRASLMGKLGTDSAAGLGRLAERLRTTGDVLG